MVVLNSLSFPDKMGPWHTIYAVTLPNGWYLELVSVAVLVVFCGLSRWFVSTWITTPIVDRLERRGVLAPGKRANFIESSFKTMHYFFTTAWGLYLLLPSSWLYNTKDCWLSFPHAMTPIFYFYFMYQGSFYIFSLYSGLFIDVRRHDWIYLIIHHIVTVSLILYAWYWGMVRIGSVVLLLMDFNDGFLEAAKSFNYIKGPITDRIATLFFVTLMLSWPVTRIILYYTNVLKPVYYEAVPLVDAQGFVYRQYEWHAFFTMLCAIGVLNVYWLVLIVLTAFNSFVRNRVGDPREEAEIIAKKQSNGKGKGKKVKST